MIGGLPQRVVVCRGCKGKAASGCLLAANSRANRAGDDATQVTAWYENILPLPAGSLKFSHLNLPMD